MRLASPETRFSTRERSFGCSKRTDSCCRMSKPVYSMIAPLLGRITVRSPSRLKLALPFTTFSPFGAAHTAGRPGGATTSPISSQAASPCAAGERSIRGGRNMGVSIGESVEHTDDGVQRGLLELGIVVLQAALRPGEVEARREVPQQPQLGAEAERVDRSLRSKFSWVVLDDARAVDEAARDQVPVGEGEGVLGPHAEGAEQRHHRRVVEGSSRRGRWMRYSARTIATSSPAVTDCS